MKGIILSGVSGTRLYPLTMVIDIAVDVRKSSSTFGQWVSVGLSAENHRQFFYPKRFFPWVLNIN